MKAVYALAAVTVIAITALMLIRRRTFPTHEVRTADLARILSQLSASTAHRAYAMLTFTPPDRPGDENVVSLQFSLEAGHPGFDWVLYQQRNIADEARFVEYARSAGFSPRRTELNGVTYWRVERGDLVALCSGVITNIYHLSPTAPIELITEGFEWPT